MPEEPARAVLAAMPVITAPTNHHVRMKMMDRELLERINRLAAQALEHLEAYRKSVAELKQITDGLGAPPMDPPGDERAEPNRATPAKQKIIEFVAAHPEGVTRREIIEATGHTGVGTVTTLVSAGILRRDDEPYPPKYYASR